MLYILYASVIYNSPILHHHHRYISEAMVVTLESFLEVSNSSHKIASKLSLSNVWHTDKTGCGRLLYDYKNLVTGTPVNSDNCRDAYRKRFAPLIYPSATTYIKCLYNAK